MKEWYLISHPPNITSGYEDDAISEYAESNFTDVLETTFSDSVTLYNSDLSESETVNCIVQGNVANTPLKSIERTILFPIGTSVAGMYVLFDNSYWLLRGIPGNNKMYEKITASLCTFKLRWQNELGNIIERWVYLEDFTRYSSGVTGNNTITIGDNQYGLYIPIDDETKILKRDTRYAIDFDDAETPDIYLLTNRKVVLNNYQSSNKGGTIIFTMSYDFFNPEKDKHVALDDGTQAWICDYHSPATPEIPLTPNETTDLLVKISGNTNLKNGCPRTYTVSFTDDDYNEVSDVEFTWKVISNFDIEQIIDGNTIKLCVDGKGLIGSSFLLQVITNDNVASEIKIEIIEAF